MLSFMPMTSARASWALARKRLVREKAKKKPSRSPTPTIKKIGPMIDTQRLLTKRAASRAQVGAGRKET
jgi:hypothetical protein